jgi:hypothetical protein
MASYVKSTNFAVKDGLPSGDPQKVVKGTEIDTEFNNIATAVGSKADLSNPQFLGTPFAPTASPGTNTTQVATTAFVVSERSTEATLTNKTLTTPKVDVINEATSAAGVTVDGVLLKDGSVASSALGSGTPSASTFLRGDRTWASGLNEANVQTFNSSGTWTKPIAGTMARIQVWGGGGSGGAQGGSEVFASGGGGGGYSETTVPLSTLDATVSVTVGAGGASRSNAAGLNGGASSFGSVVVARGGRGGGTTSYDPPADPGLSAFNGGSNGSFTGGSAFWSGGAGGGASWDSFANSSGGTSYFGGAGGGGRGYLQGNGIAGTAPGGGGGASVSGSSGAGAAGRCVVTVW